MLIIGRYLTEDFTALDAIAVFEGWVLSQMISNMQTQKAVLLYSKLPAANVFDSRQAAQLPRHE
jgi:hypothetical protein